MLDEEHLGGFYQMGFHVISCVDVCWMVGCLVFNVEYWRFMWMFSYFVLLTVAVECMLQYYEWVNKWMNV